MGRAFEQLGFIKMIPSLPGYGCTATGKVYSFKRKKIKELTHIYGYNNYVSVCVFIDGKRYRKYVHRLVAETWLDNPDNLDQVDHIDKNPTNNCVSNLRWISKYDNMHSKKLFPNPYMHMKIDKEKQVEK